ncbi:hypothetical protein CLOM_g4202 [Closterium sp. NIES-68]|nr:hypothetical protein CLOM_g4202 [Closterium sp. NIES-68]
MCFACTIMAFPPTATRRDSNLLRLFQGVVLTCFVLRLPHAVAGSDSDGSAPTNNRVSLLGRVEEFAGQLNYALPNEVRYHPERSDLPIERLGFALDARNLTNVMLGFHEPDERYGVKFSCHGPPAPASAAAVTARVTGTVTVTQAVTAAVTLLVTTISRMLRLLVGTRDWKIWVTCSCPLP